MRAPLDKGATERTRARYDRNARFYDWADFVIERLLYARWRRRLWSRVPPSRGLEVGVGTGKNMPYYPPGSHVTAVDLSPSMLGHARRKAARLGIEMDLAEMDVEHLEFGDGAFDWAVATFVFCSAPDPVQGFRELRRVVKPGGRILLLEHVRIDKPVIGRLMDLYNPLAVRITGANVNRQTVANVRGAGLGIRSAEDLVPLGLFKLIVVEA